MLITQTESFNKERRNVTNRYLIIDEEHAGTDYDGVTRPALEISTSHDKERKMFVTSITRIRVGKSFIRWAMELRNEDPCPIHTYIGQATARYSQAKLVERHNEIVDRFESMTEHDEVLEWATRAKA